MTVFLYEEHKWILKKLIESDIRFLVIGGYAVNFHGYNRATGDLDIWLSPDNETKDKLLNLFKTEGVTDESINNVKQFDFTKPALFYLGQIPLRVDFLTFISGVNFNKAFEKKDILALDEMMIPVIDLENLIASKQSNLRKKDQADVEELQKIIALQSNKKK